jgi:uncharacterized damage-inducible protein DinB
MASEFERDMQEASSGLSSSRAHVVEVIKGLSDADLARARRGGWDIGAVIKHIVDSEWHYAAMIGKLRTSPQDRQGQSEIAITSTASAVAALEAGRSALHASLGGITEDEFYELGRGGGQDYSVLSVLQNVAQHDIEHGAQLEHLRDTAPPAV